MLTVTWTLVCIMFRRWSRNGVKTSTVCVSTASTIALKWSQGCACYLNISYKILHGLFRCLQPELSHTTSIGGLPIRIVGHIIVFFFVVLGRGINRNRHTLIATKGKSYRIHHLSAFLLRNFSPKTIIELWTDIVAFSFLKIFNVIHLRDPSGGKAKYLL